VSQQVVVLSLPVMTHLSQLMTGSQVALFTLLLAASGCRLQMVMQALAAVVAEVVASTAAAALGGQVKA
jgi:hypothetical protein